MRIDVTKEWCLRMAELEADEEIGPACSLSTQYSTANQLLRRKSLLWPLGDSSR
jgi:hypothetical protein